MGGVHNYVRTATHFVVVGQNVCTFARHDLRLPTPKSQSCFTPWCVRYQTRNSFPQLGHFIWLRPVDYGPTNINNFIKFQVPALHI